MSSRLLRSPGDSVTHHGPRSFEPLARAVGAIFCYVLAMAAATMPAALALDSGLCSMEVLVDGVPLHEHSARGGTYVEALPGREYSVRLTNLTAERIAVALSVDGLNSVDAKSTPARSATKWILSPYESITIDGWQTSSATARQFFFTTEKRSYGAWMGKTQNLGLVAAAVFREKRPVPEPLCYDRWRRGRVPCPPALPYQGDSREGANEGRLMGSRERDESRQEESGASGSPASPEALQSKPLRRDASKDALSDDLAATGIGREMEHRVVRVRFDQEETPAAIMEVRYEYRDALVRLGVLPRCRYGCEEPLARRERARGFEDTDFAPDPYCRRSR